MYKCSSCISNCKECNNAYTCITCFDGYFINDDICLKCDDNCNTCVDEY